jgi:DNA-binding transcriptional LysR family regulator
LLPDSRRRLDHFETFPAQLLGMSFVSVLNVAHGRKYLVAVSSQCLSRVSAETSACTGDKNVFRRALFCHARRLLDLNKEMADRVAKPRKEGPLRLGVVDHFGPEMLPIWLSRFKETFPNVKIVSDIGLTHDLLKDLEDDKFDLVIASAGYTAMGEYRLAPSIQETHLQKETLLWVKAKNSNIDPKKAPLPLVMFGSKCRFRPIALEALQKAGRPYEIIFVGGNLNSVQTAVLADLGLSVLSPLSLAEGLAVLNEASGLPKLPTAKLAIYSRKKFSHPMVPRLTAFLVESLSAWESKHLGSKSERGKQSAQTLDAKRLTK